MKVRERDKRGRTARNWLDSYHTFSFDAYYDPVYMGFSDLRVINDDRVEANAGFPMHTHQNMEILTFVLEGTLEHRDSIGTQAQIRTGDVQLMSAGTGVKHSEYNPSATEPVHFLQVWILPENIGLPPRYEQRTFPEAEKRGQLKLIASPDGRQESLVIHQDAFIYASMLNENENVQFHVGDNRVGWLQVARGDIRINGSPMSAGDGAALASGENITAEGCGDLAEFLFFDLRLEG